MLMCQPMIVDPVRSMSVVVGSPVVLTCTVCGRPAPSVAWTTTPDRPITDDQHISQSYDPLTGIARLQVSDCLVD